MSTVTQMQTIAKSVDIDQDKRIIEYIEVISIVARTYIGKEKTIIHKFRIVINAQCYECKFNAEILIWTSNTWKLVHKLTSLEMETAINLLKRFEKSENYQNIEKDFKEDRDELIRIVSNICFE